MFERFTDKARHTVVLAQEEARRLDHSYIGTEHVLLGLLAESDGIGGRVLAQLGITLATTREDVEALVGRGDGNPPGHIPFTPRAKKVLELSLREALGLGHNYIGTEHILLGIVREGDGVATAVLEARGAISLNIRSLVQAALARADVAKGGAGGSAGDDDRRTAGADAVIAMARQLAGAGPMGSHHLLEAMTLVDDSLASGALGALGVAPDALAAKIDELGTAGTTDLSPDEAGAQQMELRITDEEVTVVLRDEEARELGRSLTEAVGGSLTGTAGTASPLVGLWRANVDALRDLVERLTPGVDELDQESSSRAAAVRAAIRNRLRRRTG
jgi:ATP-dependent Clp protease ATP-binding subunit ClpC